MNLYAKQRFRFKLKQRRLGLDGPIHCSCRQILYEILRHPHKLKPWRTIKHKKDQ